MSSFNKVIIMGNLTKDPELRSIKNGTAIANFSIALNRRYKYNGEVKDNVCFVDIVVWAKQAEHCSKHLQKGSKVLIEGYLNFRQWETADNEKRSKLEVIANNIQFLNFKKESNGNTDNK